MPWQETGLISQAAKRNQIIRLMRPPGAAFLLLQLTKNEKNLILREANNGLTQSSAYMTYVASLEAPTAAEHLASRDWQAAADAWLRRLAVTTELKDAVAHAVQQRAGDGHALQKLTELSEKDLLVAQARLFSEAGVKLTKGDRRHLMLAVARLKVPDAAAAAAAAAAAVGLGERLRQKAKSTRRKTSKGGDGITQTHDGGRQTMRAPPRRRQLPHASTLSSVLEEDEAEEAVEEEVQAPRRTRRAQAAPVEEEEEAAPSLGCSKCRHAANGCKKCRQRPNAFKTALLPVSSAKTQTRSGGTESAAAVEEEPETEAEAVKEEPVAMEEPEREAEALEEVGADVEAEARVPRRTRRSRAAAPAEAAEETAAPNPRRGRMRAMSLVTVEDDSSDDGEGEAEEGVDAADAFANVARFIDPLTDDGAALRTTVSFTRRSTPSTVVLEEEEEEVEEEEGEERSCGEQADAPKDAEDPEEEAEAAPQSVLPTAPTAPVTNVLLGRSGREDMRAAFDFPDSPEKEAAAALPQPPRRRGRSTVRAVSLATAEEEGEGEGGGESERRVEAGGKRGRSGSKAITDEGKAGKPTAPAKRGKEWNGAGILEEEVENEVGGAEMTTTAAEAMALSETRPAAAASAEQESEAGSESVAATSTAPVIEDGEILFGAKLKWVLERRVRRTPTFWGSTPLPALDGYTVLAREGEGGYGAGESTFLSTTFLSVFGGGGPILVVELHRVGTMWRGTCDVASSICGVQCSKRYGTSRAEEGGWWRSSS